ncbi:sensor histidine kinase [Deinococcus radiotolerans]|uniref:histidine kinase n=1 Tax=Deinococcus radiotolerans TaxID=1309407 RepID=A0ABQ2FRG0_9DEIO|nr:HAMP domain-containing sensor histidine kinase [Deinococcus radiotolerans]GGL19575.1 hypothetical protein GCM10010844_43160 [Deinococcus radiotolerans]
MTRPFWQTLAWRLTLAFVLVSALSLGVVGLVSTASTRAQFGALVDAQAREQLQQTVQAYVERTGSVAGFRPLTPQPPGGVQSPAVPPVPAGGPPRPGARAAPSSWVVLDPARRAVYSTPEVREGEQVLTAPAAVVTVGGKTAAFIVPSGRAPGLDQRSQEFLTRTARAIAWAMLGAAVIAVVMGLLISRTLLQPLGALLADIQALRRGEAPRRRRNVRPDELGEVLLAFGEMHETVTRNQQASRQLTADIAHDLNTPLSVVIGTLEGILDGTFQPTPERLGRLHRETQYIAQLVGDLRLLSLADAGELRMTVAPADLVSLIGEILASFQEAAGGQGVTLHQQQTAPQVTVPVDRVRLKQVVQNLLRNALAHTPAGGQVTVSVEDTPAAAWIHVSDTGQGIAAEHLPHVFNRLYRADSSRSTHGSGLGLSICTSIVEAHGGQMHIESTEGRGTRVSVSLPRPSPPSGPVERRRP